MTRKKYTLGILFSHNLHYVYLLRRGGEDWQTGKLNGVGGKIEEETAEECMAREALEETGYTGEWTKLGTVQGALPEPYHCSLFYSVLDEYSPLPYKRESQGIEFYAVSTIGIYHNQTVPHLLPIIFGALSHEVQRRRNRQPNDPNDTLVLKI